MRKVILLQPFDRVRRLDIAYRALSNSLITALSSKQNRRSISSRYLLSRLRASICEHLATLGPQKKQSSPRGMPTLLRAFQLVSVTFACLAIGTGVQALFLPLNFSHSFGLPLAHTDDVAYVSLMGVRQLCTGLTLLVFAYQRKWKEMGTLLALLGVLVAGTDGLFLARESAGKGLFHALPGLGIASLGLAVARS